MSVSNGQKANADTFNNAFLSKTTDGSTTGKLGLANASDENSGAAVENAQRAINEIFDAVGIDGEGDEGRKAYSSENYIAEGDSHKEALAKLDAAIAGLVEQLPSDPEDYLTTDNVKTVTNKDIDGGTASNSNRITIPRADKSALDALTRKEGTIVWAQDENKLYVDDGSTLKGVGSGGGGGGSSLIWIGDSGNAPEVVSEYGSEAFAFEAGLSQTIWTAIRVPSGYESGKQLFLDIAAYSPSSSGDFLLTGSSYLVRKDTDTIDSTTNQRYFTNSALTNAVSYRQREVTLDLTDNLGRINSVSVAAGDIIRVALVRDNSDTDTGAVRVLRAGAEVRSA